MSVSEELEVPATRVLLRFVGPTGRVYLAGGFLGPMVTEGQPDSLELAEAEGLGIKLTDFTVVLDD